MQTVSVDGLVPYDYTIGTMEIYYPDHKDLNECWMDAPENGRTALMTKLKNIQPAHKFYDTSATAELRRHHDRQRENVYKPNL